MTRSTPAARNEDGDPPSEGRRWSGPAALALWLAACAAGYIGLGTMLYRRAEGVEASWKVTIAALAALALLGAALLATYLWARGRRSASRGPKPALDRRRFLVGGAAAAGGLFGVGAAVLARIHGWIDTTGAALAASVVETDPNPRAEWKGARIQKYRRLGRTEAWVSDISLGSGAISEDGDGEAIAREAIARGVTYFDTSPDYSGASSERALGRAMAGQREKMFIATKFCTAAGHLPAGSSVERYVAAVEESLERLQTEYVDLVHVHACDDVERLRDPNLHAAFAQLKTAGKARFLGVSSHTPNLEAVANFAIDDGRFDVLMLAYHHGSWPNLGTIIERARSKDLGVVAMKTLKGAKHHGLAGFRDEADSYAQAAFKWVLANPAVSCLVISFYEHAHVNEYLYASGRAPAPSDQTILEKYDRLIAGKHCFAHCGACLAACPEELAIHDVLRHRMYFEDYGREKYAMDLYAKLEKQADICLGCAAPCAGACPHGVPIQERTTGAHRLLTLA